MTQELLALGFQLLGLEFAKLPLLGSGLGVKTQYGRYLVKHNKYGYHLERDDRSLENPG